MKTNLKLFTLAVFALVSMFFVTASMAQTSTTGEVVGTVTDPNQAVVPNATVTLSGPNLIRAQTSVTDDQGRFRFQQIPPGRYTIDVSATGGFGSAKRENIEVNLSRTTSADLAVAAAGVGGVVDVIATTDVDQTNNTTGTNVSTEQFSNFPTGRTVQSLYTIAPTVARSGLRDASGRDRDPSVAGSSGPENNYILDGVNATDPAFGGSGANLPFEFVQEIEIKTGAYGAEYGKATGGIFNVITKSGSNQFHGDVFAYFTNKGFVREVKSNAIPFTGAAANGFSEIDAGFDIGGPIVKDKLWFFGAFNPQKRKNYSLTQTFLQQVQNEITTPFYAGKLTWGINNNHTFTFSTFSDLTKQEGHVFGFSGFGADLRSFRGTVETGGSNYAFRLNSTMGNTIGEFSFGLHYQRANTSPELDQTLVTDRFAVLRGSGIVAPVETTVCADGTISTTCGGAAGVRLAYVEGTGGTIQRNFVRSGFGLKSQQDRDRWEWAARLQTIWGKHTFKYGFEYNQNKYRIDTLSTGGNFNFGGDPSLHRVGPNRIENRFAICSRTAPDTITCPSGARTTRVQALIAAGQAPAGVTTAVTGAVSANPTNPFLLLDVVRARDFDLDTRGGFTKTNTESFWLQDDYRVHKNLQFNLGLRWDYQQALAGDGSTYIALNSFWDNMQPRAGIIWDYTGQGRGKFFVNFARFVETPIPLDINVRAAGADVQNDYHSNVSRLNGTGAVIVSNLGNLGNHVSPINMVTYLDADANPHEVTISNKLKPQTVNEVTMGFEHQLRRDFAVGVRGIYRAQGSVIEDGSLDEADHYFIFNPGERGTADQPTAEDIACSGLAHRYADANFSVPLIPTGCFGRARRYYRALEFTATKRFSNNYQFIASYVFSSLIGNYEGLFRNDNGQSDPNITSLFDLTSLLQGMYGRLPNDRPHQFKFNGSYQTPWRLVLSGNFYAQSGIPFNRLIPHFLYGDNEGFGVPRGTAINPITGKNRTPTTFNVDFGAYYPIKVGESREFRLTFDWFNVTNTQRAVRQDETFQINSGAPGVPPTANPFYGTGTIYQFPSALRLGAKFTF